MSREIIETQVQLHIADLARAGAYAELVSTAYWLDERSGLNVAPEIFEAMYDVHTPGTGHLLGVNFSFEGSGIPQELQVCELLGHTCAALFFVNPADAHYEDFMLHAQLSPDSIQEASEWPMLLTLGDDQNSGLQQVEAVICLNTSGNQEPADQLVEDLAYNLGAGPRRLTIEKLLDFLQTTESPELGA